MTRDPEIMLEELLRSAWEKYKAGKPELYRSIMNKAGSWLKRIPDSSPLWGEWLLLTGPEYFGDICSLGARLQKAAEYIPAGSHILPRGCPFFWGYVDPLLCCGPGSIRAEDNCRCLEAAEKVFTQLTGGGQGTSLAYWARLCYLRGELDQALVLARKAKEVARAFDQEQVFLCATATEARISIHHGDLQLWQSSMKDISRLAEDRDGSEWPIWQAAQILKGLLGLAIGITDSVPEWISRGDLGAIAVPGGYRIVGDNIYHEAFPSALLLRGYYKLAIQDPVGALEVADLGEKVYKIQGRLHTAYMELLRAEAYRRLEETELNKQALSKAMELVIPEGLYMVPGTFADFQGEGIYKAAAKFSPLAPDIIERIGQNYRSKIRELHGMTVEDAKLALSPRELEVAGHVAAGLKNAQIAQKMEISIRTVERHLDSTYRKCGVNSRSDLARIIKEKEQKRSIWLDMA